MKRLSIFVVLIYFVFISPVCSQNTADTDSLKGPNIEFAETTCDFGTVSSDTTVYYTFIFTNTGNDSLRIKGVRPG